MNDSIARDDQSRVNPRQDLLQGAVVTTNSSNMMIEETTIATGYKRMCACVEPQRAWETMISVTDPERDV